MSSDFNISRSHASVSSANELSNVAEQRVEALQNTLVEAAKNNDLATLEKLFFDPNAIMPEGFDEAFTDGCGRTLLHIAAEAGSDDFVRELVERFPGNSEFLDMVDDDGYTALMYVAGADTDKPELVKVMIDFGASINVQAESVARTFGSDDYALKKVSALTRALAMDNVETAAVLVKAGADTAVELRNAANAFDKKSLDSLVSLDADVGVAFTDAVEHEQKRATFALSYLLLDRDAPLEPLSPTREPSSERAVLLLSQYPDERAALIHLAGQGKVNDVRALLDHGVDGGRLLADTILTEPAVARSLMAAGVSSSAGMAHAFVNKDDDAVRILHLLYGASHTEALVQVAESGDTDAVNVMITQGADVTEALVQAALNGKARAAAMLAEIQAAATRPDKA